MALSLVNGLKRRLDNLEFIFAVDPTYYKEEKKWGDYYGLKVVRRDTAFLHLAYTSPVFILARRLYGKIKKKPRQESKERVRRLAHEHFMEAYRNCDAVINMMGISYVGDGARGPLEGLVSYSSRYYANKFKKPFTYFIQSFGPFEDWRVRLFAKHDFAQADFIPARGMESAKLCKSIVKNQDKVYDFPDTAIMLPTTNSRWLSDYLSEIKFSEKNYVVLSPSAVIYNLPARMGGCVGKLHVRSFCLIAKKLLSENKFLLFLPHMYSSNKKECDREVCRKVIKDLKASFKPDSKFWLVEEDLDVWQAKGLISKAQLAIVSRYHALVAAVSTGVPAVTVGWNIKYRDLMKYYGIESMAVDIRQKDPEQLSSMVFTKLREYAKADYSKKLVERHKGNIQKVEKAFDILSDWLVANDRD